MPPDDTLIHALLKAVAELQESVVAIHRRLDAAGIAADPGGRFTSHDETQASVVLPERPQAQP